MPASHEEQKFQAQARMLADKVRKRYQHLRKRFARESIEVFRLYDWDIPEIRAVVDWYAGHLVIGEYTRRQTVAHWLPLMGAAAAAALNVPPAKVHLKMRYYGQSAGKRYERLAHTNQLLTVSERDLQFLVNPNDFVDTGLFSDHRDTRRMVRDQAQGKDVLNLYCYTGAFTCAAAKGGARSTVSVDRSRTAIAWARRNLAVNHLDAACNTLVQSDILDYLAGAARRRETFDLVVVDPPSFSTRRSREHHFDILTDHPSLLAAVRSVVRAGGCIYFSTNHQQFVPRLEDPALSGAEEITDRTIPEDYRRKRHPVHRCWKISV